ncbi:dipeptidyl peptidase IV/CD26, N-terminal domain-containing protein [Gymnopus androsaceus JB14]|uniref:Dipeptidyl peptidase IV/CD26, N-terminal domain-containing protein n=1 Tax=Gymnopus androsaceus JB14 TaxID=1447944 RepID=A0A6A4I3Q7_9AGAR|nr:dipeptidyl peptidase IV/CD26, N-terminal domain-containing protein [Gymnopus androsaceus JB14]
MRIPSYERLETDDPSETSTIAASISSNQSKPTTYYGEGEFDAPSSDSEEEDGLLLEKGPSSPGIAESGNFDASLAPNLTKKVPCSNIRFLVTTLVILVTLSGIIGIIAAQTYVGGTPKRLPGNHKITMEHIFNGTFAQQRSFISWVPEAGDGVFSLSDDGFIKLVDLKTNTTSNLVNTADIKDERGIPLQNWYIWQLSPDMKHLLVKADHKKQWRHSSFGNYYIHNIAEKSTHPMISPTNPPTTAYATWSPTGESLAYVTDNDLYILTSPLSSTAPIRVTTSGNASLFHGVPDWVYEEEIFSSDYSLWWSPDSQKVAFLRFDETAVDEFSFPIYNPTEDNDAVVPYTSGVTMKYPKPGYNNPLVSVHVFDLGQYLNSDSVVVSGFPAANDTLELDWEGRHLVQNSIIMEVSWVDDAHLIVKEVNRNADSGSVVFFDLNSSKNESRSHGTVVRRLGKHGEEGDDGWIDNNQNIFPLPKSMNTSGYLDIVPTSEGYNHIALFSPANSSTPRFLTSGQMGGLERHQRDRRKARCCLPIPRQSSDIYSPYQIPPTSSAKGTTVSAYYDTNFSPEAGFYLLSYADFNYVLTTNEALRNRSSEYEAPTILYSTIESDGFELNVKEIRPPRMDDSGRTKYAVLFFVYGGPFSQMVNMRYNRDWLDYLACGMQYVVVIADGRGTGYKGRKLRNPVKNNLGYFETIDQINAAKIWAAKEYVDPKRIGIYGWSYGGFMSSKVAEADAGIHSLAMAVAPVTSWRLYDSIYTERYMNLPALNEGGYINASISNVTGFQHIEYLLAHGSGDDNVHYANSAHLLDMFTKAQVRNFRFRMFTDSDHAINKRGANREVYEYMVGFLEEKWGKGGRRRGW